MLLISTNQLKYRHLLTTANLILMPKNMLNDRVLKQITSRVLKAANPKKIILFGSHVRKEADEDSDLDLLVIEQEIVDRGKEMIKIRNAIGDVGIGVDVLVCSEAYVDEWRHVRNTLIHQALKEGKILYEKPT